MLSFFLNLQGATTYNIELGTSELGNLTRIENAINEIPKKLEDVKSQLESYRNQIKVTEEELKKPFPYADELKEKSARLAKLNVELTISERGQTQTPENPEVKPEETQKIENPSEIKAAYGIPETKPQITEQMIKDLKLIDGEPIIYANPKTNGQQFKGEIRHVDKENGYCVQLVGQRSLFVHSLEKLERVPEVGENLKISFSDENQKATMKIQETQVRTRCRK